MGVISVVIPLLPEHRDEIAAWLRSLNIACPESAGRYPSLQELRTVLDHLDGYTTSYNTGAGSDWYAEIVPANQEDDEWVFIEVNNDAGNQPDAHKFSFAQRGDMRLILLILQRLARVCGPLMVVEDTGALPVVVTPDLDLDQALLRWEKRFEDTL